MSDLSPHMNVTSPTEKVHSKSFLTGQEREMLSMSKRFEKIKSGIRITVTVQNGKILGYAKKIGCEKNGNI